MMPGVNEESNSSTIHLETQRGDIENENTE